jgi:hypothetical protein
MLRFTIAIIFILLTNSGISQDLGLVQYDGLPNSIINPAFDSDHKILIGLGSKSYDFGNSAFTLKDAFLDNDRGGKTLQLNGVVDQLSQTNLLRFNEGLKTFELAYKIKNTFLYIGHEWKLNAALKYTDDLIKLAANGNEQFIGQTIEMGPGVLYNSYNQTALGFSTGNEKFRFGARLKILNGAQNLHSGNNQLNLTTSDDIYQLSLDADYELFSTEVLDYTDIDVYDFNTERLSFNNFLSKNWGYGIDVGISTTLGKVEIFMSGVDLGSITWDSNSNKYMNKGITEFAGVDIEEFIGNDTDFSIADSIKSLITLDKEAQKYSSSTNGKIYLGGKYKVNKVYTLGAVLSREALPIDHNYVIMANIQRPLGRYMNIAASVTYKDKSITNVGGHLTFEYGPIMLYAISHNAIGGILPENFKSLSIRFGANLQFGHNETPE